MIPQEQRDAARTKHAEVIGQLEAGENVVVPADAPYVETMSELTVATGREVALLRLEDGRQILTMGDKSSVELPSDVKIIAHTHPGGRLWFSKEDEAALHAAGQDSSVLIGPGGKAVRLKTSGVDDAQQEMIAASGKATRLSERGDENLNQAGIEAAFSRATEPHPDQAQYQLKGRSNFAFNSYETEHWPDQLTTFLSDQFHVEHDRLRVVRFGAGKSGDLVFGVFLDSKSLGLLKIYRDPQGAGTDAHILHVVNQAHIEHYVPAQDKGGIADVSITAIAVPRCSPSWCQVCRSSR